MLALYLASSPSRHRWPPLSSESLVPHTGPAHTRRSFSLARIYFDKTVAGINLTDPENVCGVVGTSVWDTLLFSYTTKAVMLTNTAASRRSCPSTCAQHIYAIMRGALHCFRLHASRASPGSGFALGVNAGMMAYQRFLARVAGLEHLALRLRLLPHSMHVRL